MAFEAGATYAILGADLSQLIEGFTKGERASEQFAKGVEQRVEKTERSFSHLGSAITGIFTGIGFKAAEVGFDLVGRGAQAAFSAISGGMGDARDSGLLLAQTENVIKSTGAAAGVSAEHVVDLATALSDASGKSLFGDDQIQASENLLLTFTNLKGGVLDAATAMSVDLAQAMGGAPKDSAIQLGKALNDPIKGVSALSRVGVTFTDEQKAQIKAMQDAGDMAGAQGVILAELNKEFGGSAAAAAKAAGPMAQIRGVLGEAAETVGGALLPALDSFSGWLGSPAILSGINTFAANLASGIASAVSTIGAVATSLMGIAGHVQNAFGEGGITAAIDTFLFDVGKVVPVLQPVTSFLRDLLPQAVSLATTTFNIARDSVLTFIAAYNGDWQNSDRVLLIHQAFGVLGQVIGGTVVPAIQSMVGWFQQNWDLVTKIGVAVGVAVAVFQTLSTVVTVVGTVTAAISGMGAVVGAAGGILGAIVAVLGGPVTIALGAVALAAGALALAWQTNFGGIQEKTQAVVNWWVDTAQPAIGAAFTAVVTQVGIMRDAWDRDFETVRGFIQTLQERWDTTTAAIGVAIDLVKGYISGFRDTVQTKLDEAVAFFTALPGRVTSAVSGFATVLLQAGKDLIQGLIDGIKSIDVGTVLGGIVRGGIDAAKRMAGIKSPSTVTRDEVGRPLVQGIIVGVDRSEPELKRRLINLGATMPTNIADGMKKQPNPVKQALLQNLGDPTIVSEAGEKARNLGAAVKQHIVRGLMEQAQDFLRDAINLGDPKILEDAYQKGKAIGKEAARGAADGGRSGANAFLDAISGPSTGAAFGSGTPNAGGAQHVPGAADLGRKSVGEMTDAWVGAMQQSEPVMITQMTDTLHVLSQESIVPWAEGLNERLQLSAGFWMQSLADGISGNRTAIDAMTGMGRDMAAALTQAWGPPVLPPPIVSGSPVPDSVASGADVAASSRTGHTFHITVQATPGTPQENRIAAHQGAEQGMNAALRSLGERL